MPSFLVNSIASLMVIIPLLGCALSLLWSLSGVRASLWIWRVSTTILLILSSVGMVVFWPDSTPQAGQETTMKLVSMLSWVRTNPHSMSGPIIDLQLVLNSARLPLLLAINVLCFALAWSRRFENLGRSDSSRSWLTRILLLSLIQASMILFCLSGDALTLISSQMMTVLLFCSLLCGWGESERRSESVDVFGYWMTSSVLIACFLLMIVGGLASLSAGQGAAVGQLDFVLSQLVTRINPGLNTDPMLANAFSQIRPYALIALVGGICMWSGSFPFHRWIVSLFRQLPFDLFGLVTLWLSMGMMVLLTRLAMPMMGDMMSGIGVWWMTLCCFTSLYVSLIALAQTDLRRLMALSIVRDLVLILLSVLTLRDLGIAAGWILALQLPMWALFMSSLTSALFEKFGEVDRSCYSGLRQVSTGWSRLWLAGILMGYGVPLLGMFPSRGLIYLSLSRIDQSGIFGLLFLTLISEICMCWSWWRVGSSMLWGELRVPMAVGPVFDQLPSTMETVAHLKRPFHVTSSPLSTILSGLLVIVLAVAPGLTIDYFQPKRASVPENPIFKEARHQPEFTPTPSSSESTVMSKGDRL